jgi:hypothetical protein
MTLESSRQSSKSIQISNLMNIRPVGTELFHADRRTDVTKLIVALRNSANAPKKDELYKTFTILDMAGVSADCGAIEFARCCAQCAVW